jgi:hypothetical protein
MLGGIPTVIMEVRYDSIVGAVRQELVINGLSSLLEGVGSKTQGVYPDYAIPFPWPTVYGLRQTDSTCTQITSISDFFHPQVYMPYPNPFDDIIQVDLDSDLPEPYRVFDLTGRIRHQGMMHKDSWINTETWLPGLYILSINGQIMKMIKQ